MLKPPDDEEVTWIPSSEICETIRRCVAKTEAYLGRPLHDRELQIIAEAVIDDYIRRPSPRTRH